MLRKIGEGGMGMVFIGQHTLIGRHAAIKILKPHLCEHKETLDRFFNEARATSAIRDPGIPALFDFGITPDNSAYIVMELLEGESVDVRVHRLGVLSPADALRITRQVASSLAAVHAAGIVHRDLKPANLFIVADPEATAGERVKILDFGIAKLGPDLRDGSNTRTGAVMGTPIYMSPEQCGGKVVDHRSDIYSLGCVLFDLIAGRPPFDVPGAGPVIAAHLKEPPPKPSSVVSQPLPPGLDELVLRCLDKSPDERYQTMLDVVRECDRLLATLPGPQFRMSAPRIPAATTKPLYGGVQPTTLGGAVGQTIPPPPRRIWVGAGLALGALAIGALLAVMVTRGGSDHIESRAPVQPPPAKSVLPPIEAAAPPVDAAVLIDATELATEPVPAKPGEPTKSTKVKARAKSTSSSSGDLYDDRN
ncbi:MAG TPA: serine/threonine-protein kinase [Kofleriaceae bacterium]|nr:serine/threonine-protein kinase [Kofleriaceae bacterium]